MNTQIITTLIDAISAIDDERKALDNYFGDDWGWHGYDLTSKRDKCLDLFEKAFNEAIDERVKAILSEQNND